MKRSAGWTITTPFWCGVLGLCCALVWSSGGGAQAAEEQESEERTAAALDQEANTPAGAARVTERLATEFGVEQTRITSLRDQQLGYGEIHHALSLAKQLPGGITDDNINKIMTMRQEQKMGWGNIAQELGGTLGPAVKPHQQGSVPPEATTPSAGSTKSLVRPGRSTNPSGHNRGNIGFGRPQGGNARGIPHGSPQNTFGVGSQGKSLQAPGHNR